MRSILTLAAVLFAAPAFANDPPFIKRAPLAQSSVYVSVDLGNGATGGGTGTVIACENKQSLVLTNAHVVESPHQSVSVTYWWKGEPYKQPATYLGGSSVTHLGPHLIQVNGPDLALLMVNAELEPVEIADAIPAVGTPVHLYGFGGTDPNLYGTRPILKTGKVLPEPGWTEPAMKTSIPSVNGDSGSGIFNEQGQLVAVLWGGGSVRIDTVYTFTTKTLERNGIFQRLKDRLAARRITKAFNETFGTPPKVK